MVGVAVAVVIARVFGIHEREVGPLHAALPPLVHVSWGIGEVVNVLPAALALAFVCSVNTLMASRVVDQSRGRCTEMEMADADAELRAYGIANICAGIFGAPLSLGSSARSVAAVRCGARTALANLLHAAILGVVLWLGSGAISRVPAPALAGVTAWMGLCLLDVGGWKKLREMSRTDASAFLATAVSLLVVNAGFSFAIGCSVYLVRLRPRASLARIHGGGRNADDGKLARASQKLAAIVGSEDVHETANYISG